MANRIAGRIKDSELGRFIAPWLDLNRWVVFIFILATALSTVFYINNVMNVNRLYRDIRVLERKAHELENRIKVTQSQVIKLQSGERIIPIAANKLGMVKPDKAPKIIP